MTGKPHLLGKNFFCLQLKKSNSSGVGQKGETKRLCGILEKCVRNCKYFALQVDKMADIANVFNFLP
jgi:hypothetical protein